MVACKVAITVDITHQNVHRIRPGTLPGDRLRPPSHPFAHRLCRTSPSPSDSFFVIAQACRKGAGGGVTASRPKAHRATDPRELPSPARVRARTGSRAPPPSDQTPHEWVVPIRATSRVTSPRTHGGHTERCPRTTRGPVRHSGRIHGR